jgi:hypothetical protein
VSREEGRTRSVTCSRSVSEPEPPRRERANETRDVELAVDEEDEEEKVGGMGERERDEVPEGVESEEREGESEEVMEESLSMTCPKWDTGVPAGSKRSKQSRYKARHEAHRM